MRLSFIRQILLMTTTLLFSSASLAHVGAHTSSSLSAGLLHPITGLDHLIMLLLVGLFISSMARMQAAQVLGLVSLTLGLGFVAGLVWAVAPQVEWLVLLSLFALPLAFIAYRNGRGLKGVAMLAIGLFSASHGLVQGAESLAVASQGEVVQFGLGSLVTSLAVIATTALLTRVIRSLLVGNRSLRGTQ